MDIFLKQLPQSQVELTIEVTPEEIKPHLIWATEQLSRAHAIAGFRPGKAPYELAEKQFGAMKILETAAERIIKQTYFQAIQEKKLKTLGAPQINVEKMAPGNPLVFKAAVALMPALKLADWQKIKIKRQKKEITAAETEKVLADLRKMRAKEIIADRAAQKTDKVLVDMDILVNNVPIEGGQTKNHSIYLEDDYYIPGLADQLINSKKGADIEFQLSFPENFYQKTLAGKKADFKVKVKDVYELQLPELNDDFAKALGQQNPAELKKVLQENLQAEADQKEEQKAEIEMLQKIIEGSKFEEIPEILISEEKQKMFAELKQNLTDQGINFEDYLKNIKKTTEEIANGFSKGAEERAKTALILREIAIQEKVEISPDDLKKEMERVREMYKENEQINERVAAPELRDFIAQSLLNRRVLVKLKEKIIS